jgi:DNA-binding response OmpR family regulator
MSATATPVRKVLIVEDEGDMCFLLELVLNGKGTSVDHVKTLAEAKAFLEENTPDLILLDNRLPDGLGVDFLPILRAQYPDIRVIMISGKDASAVDFALESGADAFLLKPFTRDELKASVEGLLLN